MEAKFENIGNLTQTQYLLLMQVLSGALRTQRRFIELLGKKLLPDGKIIYRVKSRGKYYQIILDGYRTVSVAYEI